MDTYHPKFYLFSTHHFFSPVKQKKTLINTSREKKRGGGDFSIKYTVTESERWSNY